MQEEINRPPLVGKYFHSLDDDGEVIWQGKIVSALPDNKYLVQLFNWIDGAPSNQEIIKSDDLLDWIFYSSYSAWVDAGNKVFLGQS